MQSKAQTMEQLKFALLQKTQEHGFALASSQQSGGRSAMCHTIGLWAAAGHPELVIFEENLDLAELHLNELGRRVMAGEFFLDGVATAERRDPMKLAGEEQKIQFSKLSDADCALARAMSVWALGESQASSQWVEARLLASAHSSPAFDWLAKEAPRRVSDGLVARSATPWASLGNAEIAQSYIAMQHPQLSASASAPKPSERLTFWASARGAAIQWGERLIHGLERAQSTQWVAAAWAWRPHKELSVDAAGSDSSPFDAQGGHSERRAGEKSPNPLEALNRLFDLPPTQIKNSAPKEGDLFPREEAIDPPTAFPKRAEWRLRGLGAAREQRASRPARVARRAQIARRKAA